MSSATLRHLKLDFKVHVIGASHLIQCGRWSELLSCATRSEIDPVFSLGPDFTGKQPFKYRDHDLRFEFEIRRIETGDAAGLERLEQARLQLARYKVQVTSEFARAKADHAPPMTRVGVDPLQQGLEVRSLHYYSQESTAVLSRSVTVVQ